MCQPDSTPAGISVSTCTISRPGIEDARCWSSVRLSFPASASIGCCSFVMGLDDMIGPPHSLSSQMVSTKNEGQRYTLYFRKVMLEKNDKYSEKRQIPP